MTSRGGTTTELHGLKKGEQHIHATESTRRLNIGGEKAPPPPDDIIRQTLYRQFVTSPHHDAAGTRIEVPTGHLRFLVYFPATAFPLKITTVQISAHGAIKEDVMRQEMVKKDNLWILEAGDLEPVCGVYVCWVWEPEAAGRSGSVDA